MVLRTTLVIIHAVSGVGGLLTGFFALSPPRPNDNRTRLRGLYLVSLGILLGSMVVLIVIDWNDLDGGSRIAFTALAGLGAVMAYRIVRAQQMAVAKSRKWQERYVDHVYFTYISLWEGFVILPALNLSFPQVTVPAVAIAVLLIGHALISGYKRRLPATASEG